MSAPERIWANLEFGEDKCYPVETEKFGDGKFYSAEDAEEYIRADTVAEMIRQAVADAEAKALRKAAAKIRPSLPSSGNGIVIAALHRKADEIEAMIPKEGVA